MDVALLQEYLEPVKVYEKRPLIPRGAGNQQCRVPDEVRMCLYAIQRGVCPGCGIHLPHYLRLEVDHILAPSDYREHDVKTGGCYVPTATEWRETRGKAGFG